MAGITATAVSERAGVSVGTVYQYFPNKQALVYALNERFLTRLAEKVGATCDRMAGRRASEAAEALIDTYWAVKTEWMELTHALYRSVAELDNDALIHDFAARVDKATTGMFRASPDLSSEDIDRIYLASVGT